MFGHRRRGVVRGGDGDSFEQRAERRRVARAEAHAIPRCLRRPRADQDRLVPLRAIALDRLTCQVERHELHETRRRMVFRGVLREQDLALRVEEEHSIGTER